MPISLISIYFAKLFFIVYYSKNYEILSKFPLGTPIFKALLSRKIFEFMTQKFHLCHRPLCLPGQCSDEVGAPATGHDKNAHQAK